MCIYIKVMKREKEEEEIYVCVLSFLKSLVFPNFIFFKGGLSVFSFLFFSYALFLSLVF